jgi:hypothetical protein
MKSLSKFRQISDTEIWFSEAESDMKIDQIGSDLAIESRHKSVHRAKGAAFEPQKR